MTRDGKGQGGDDRERWGKDFEANKNSFQCFFFPWISKEPWENKEC